MKVATVLVTGVAACAVTASATAQSTFLLDWSGASYGNGASASGSITFAPGFPGNPEPGPGTLYTIGVEVLALNVTVTGASAGNGSFTTGDFINVVWGTQGAMLDLSMEAVGQPTAGGPWGQTGLSGANGDFNLFSSGAAPSSPTGTFYFELSTNGGVGDMMALTSSRPIPAPGAIGVLGLAGLVAVRRRR